VRSASTCDLLRLVTSRVVEVDPERLERWIAGFGERHDGACVQTDGAIVMSATGGDGTVARFEHFAHDPLGIILVRRGGYAVGLAVGGALAASKVGARHVQSRTAAGGWSQQRFARRRDNQADALVDAVTRHAVRILLGGNESPRRGAPGIPDALVVGGDKALVAQVLEDATLRSVAGLPRRELYDLPDPKRAVLEDALRRGRAVRVELTESR
jgi:hypothetical protein